VSRFSHKNSARAGKIKSLTFVSTSVKLPAENLKDIDELAREEGVPRSEEIRRSIQLYLQIKTAMREGDKALVLIPKEKLKDELVVVLA